MNNKRRRPRRTFRRRRNSGQIFVDNSTFNVPAGSSAQLSQAALAISRRSFKVIALGVTIVSSTSSGCIGQIRVFNPEQRGYIFTTGPICCGTTPYIRRFRIPGPHVWWPLDAPSGALVVTIENICISKTDKPSLWGTLRTIIQLSAETVSNSCPARHLEVAAYPPVMSSPTDAEPMPCTSVSNLTLRDMELSEDVT